MSFLIENLLKTDTEKDKAETQRKMVLKESSSRHKSEGKILLLDILLQSCLY